jgi:hypothetical protein
LKRAFMATLEELLLSAEYILAGGNDRVVLCERGIRTFERTTRFTLDISAVPLLQEETSLPVIVDLSHALGRKDIMAPCARAALPHGSERTSATCFTYTMTWNLTGWPGAVVRAGTSAGGLPVGVQLVARPWREDVALAAAALVEAGLGGFQPPGAPIGAPRRAS